MHETAIFPLPLLNLTSQSGQYSAKILLPQRDPKKLKRKRFIVVSCNIQTFEV